ncbi:MAG: glycosyltransferase family 2 protein [Pseudomonadota bacterium]
MTRISLIISTFNRAASLEKSLPTIEAAVAASPQVPVEIILVDNGSTDATPQLLAAWKARVTFPVIVIREMRPGVSCGRNAGMRAATGDIFAFSDDDCHLNPDFFSAMARCYAADTTPVLRGGRVDLGTSDDIAFSIKTLDETVRMDGRSFPGGFLMGANMAVTRTIVDRIGYFDERYGGGAIFPAAEDADYLYRAFLAGFVVEYTPEIIVHHFHGRSDIATIKKLNYGYHIGNGALFAKNITRLNLLRHFIWSSRQMVREIFGGPLMYPPLGLTYRDAFVGNLHGMALYVKHLVGRRQK